MTIFLKSVGFGSSDDLIDLFGAFDKEGCIKNTLEKDATETEKEALIEIYKKLRPGEPPTVESARNLISALFFNPKRYDFGKVGRYKINRKSINWAEHWVLPDSKTSIMPYSLCIQ